MRHSALQKKLDEAIDKGFASSFAEEKQFSHFDTALEKGKSALAEKILKTLNSSPLSPQLNKELQKALDGLNTVHTEEYLKNYSALTVSPLLKRCKAYADEYESCREEFEALKDRAYTDAVHTKQLMQAMMVCGGLWSY